MVIIFLFAILTPDQSDLQELFDLHSSYQLQEERDRIEKSVGSCRKRELVEKVFRLFYYLVEALPSKILATNWLRTSNLEGDI